MTIGLIEEKAKRGRTKVVLLRARLHYMTGGAAICVTGRQKMKLIISLLAISVGFARQSHADCVGGTLNKDSYSFTVTPSTNSLSEIEIEAILNAKNPGLEGYFVHGLSFLRDDNSPSFSVFISNNWDGSRLSADDSFTVSIKNVLLSLKARGLIQTVNDNPNIAEKAWIGKNICR